MVNSKGYLIDGEGNVIDKQGCVVFEKSMLEKDEIPAVFRSGVLKDENSEMSKLMD